MEDLKFWMGFFMGAAIAYTWRDVAMYLKFSRSLDKAKSELPSAMFKIFFEREKKKQAKKVMPEA